MIKIPKKPRTKKVKHEIIEEGNMKEVEILEGKEVTHKKKTRKTKVIDFDIKEGEP